MTDLELYNKYKQPPQWALKQITGGRLKGMTDIKPQWRIDVLTETFGICGFGWYPEIVRQWIETSPTGEMVANTQINLYVYKNGEWSKPIPAVGGAMLVAKEKNGPYTSDEAYKMSYTDALSVACKQLGIAGDIYRGNSGHSKYETSIEPEKTPAEKAKETREANKKAFEERFAKMYAYFKGKPEWSYTMETNFNAVMKEAMAKGYEQEKCSEMLEIFDKLEKDSIPTDILDKEIKPEDYLKAG